jgi:hypothetical protein
MTFRKYGIWPIFGKVTVGILEFCNLDFGKKRSSIALPPLEKLASEASSNRTAINFLKGIISEAM